MLPDIRTRSLLQELPGIRDSLEAELNAMSHPGLTQSVIDAVVLASVEAVSNVMRHAYAKSTDREMLIRVWLQDVRLCIQILHHGDRAMPERIAEPDFSGTNQKGFGLFIMRESVDSVTYSQEQDGWQSVLLTKQLT